MLNGKQRSYLRSLSNTLEAIFQVGKGGINDNVIKQFDQALEVRELVKTTVHRSSLLEVREVAEEIATAVRAEVVQVIGNKFVLYRESVEKSTIILP